MAAEEARQQLEEQARAEAKARTGVGLGLLGKVAGAGLGFALGGPMGAAAGLGIASQLFGGGSQQTSPAYNFYLDPRQWGQQGSYPIYLPLLPYLPNQTSTSGSNLGNTE